MMATASDASADVSKGSCNQLHDLFSIAEIESALSAFNPSNVKEDTSFGIRLPFLLRCLAALQARSDITPYLKQESIANSQSSCPNDNVIAMLLEDVAASHSGAENVEVLLALAPSLCNDAIGKSVGKISQLSRQKSCFLGSTGGDMGYSKWDTKGLGAALDHLSSTDIRLNKRGRDEEHMPEKKQKIENGSDSDGDIIPPPWVSAAAKEGGSEADKIYSTQHSSFAANDSYESAMQRTLQELISLVKSSLDSEAGLNGDIQEDEDKPMVNGNSFHKDTVATPGLSVKSESLFAETNPTSSAFGVGCSSLSVMVVILMHHAPVLRYDHVSTALCRAAVPQAPTLIQHLAANCPASVTCLLKGITTAYKLATQYKCMDPTSSSTDDMDPLVSGAQVSDILKTSVDSIKSLASLSKSEASSMIHTLRKYDVMDDLILEMLIDHDPAAGAAFIVEKLSVCSGGNDTPLKSKRKSLRRQSSSSVEQQPRPVPLRQRMIGSQKNFEDAKDLTRQIVQDQSNTQQKLVAALRENNQLLEHCMQRISEKISVITLCAGEVALYLRAFALLVHRAESYGPASANKILHYLPGHAILAATSADNIPKRSSVDDVYKLALCATLLVWSKCKHTEDSMTDEDETTAKACEDCIKRLLAHPPSLECVVFSSRLAGFVIGNEANNMMSVILKCVYSSEYSMDGAWGHKEALCCASSVREQLEQLHKTSLTLRTTVYNPIVAVEAMRRSGPSQSTHLDELIKNLLDDPKSCRDICHHPMAYDLMRESVNMMLRRSGPHIPHVLPFTLERKAMSISWFSSRASQDICSQFVVQLLYALSFLREEPKSPFAINPRSFPLKEAMFFVTSDSSHPKGEGHDTLVTVLRELISNHCPDVIEHTDNLKLMDCTSPANSCVGGFTPLVLHQAIHDSIGDSSKDPSGMRVEKIYSQSSSHLTTDALVTTVCSAVLTSRQSQQRCLSYLHLYKDPLVVFKAPAAAWKCSGLRRVMMKTLCHLMASNEAIAMKSSRTRQVAMEFLASRNAIILRCLLFVQTNLSPTHCVLSANTIRSIISHSPGITALLLKQGVDDGTIDYLCRYIPESFSDAVLLSNILSQKESLSVPERLVLANVSLRIAIAHYSRGEAMAKEVVIKGLGVLLESFQFAIGPMGVPVSVLRGQADESDTTDICRTALFQMMDAICSVHPDSTLKAPCISIIGRLASMCKSEGTSVGSGAVGAQRKALLKRIWDACVVANIALGAEIQM